MPPDREISAEYASAVLARGCIDELRYPRICAARQCRRHKHCFDIADHAPRCVDSLHPIDFDRLSRLHRLVRDILEDRHQPGLSRDRAERDHEDEAIMVLFDCVDALPCFRARIFACQERFDAPPQPAAPPRPPAPPVDTGKLLAEIKAEIARNRVIDETRAETDALRQRLAAPSGGRA